MPTDLIIALANPPTGLGGVVLRLGAVFTASLLTVGVCLLPGWSLARRWCRDADLAILLSLLGSLTVISLAVMATYFLGVSHLLAVVIVLGFAAYSVVDLLRSPDAGARPPWDLCLTWFALACIIVAMQIPIAVAGPPHGLWDWCEHWERSRILYEHRDVTEQIRGFHMTSRGGLVGTVAVIVYTLFGQAPYWLFQIISGITNSCYCLGFFVLCHRVLGFNRRWCVLIAALVPLVHFSVSHSMIFSWPKNMSAGLMLTALILYGQGLRQERPRLMGAGLFGFSLAFLAHFLAFPFAVFFWLHFAVTRLRHGRAFRLACIALVASAIVVTAWFLPSFHAVGIRQSLGANTTISGYGDRGGANDLTITFYNTVTTLLPRVVFENIGLSPSHLKSWDSQDWMRVFVQEYTDGPLTQKPLEDPPFSQQVTGMWYGFGPAGAAAVACVLILAASRVSKPRLTDWLQPDRRFWILFFTVGLLINIAPVRWISLGGVTNLNLQLYIYFFLIFVLACLRGMPRPLAWLLGAVILASGYLQVMRYIAIQSLVIDVSQTASEDWSVSLPLKTPVYAYTIDNTILKVMYGAVYLRDLIAGYIVPAVALFLLIAAAVLSLAVRLASTHAPDIPAAETPEAANTTS